MSSELNKLSEFHHIDYPKASDILQAYLKFEVLFKHKYDFSCVECGDFPSILITDVNKKCAFRLKGAFFFLIP